MNRIERAPRILVLGSGRDRTQTDAVTMDIQPRTNPDVVHDLNVRPWPIADDSFEVIYCKDIIEHVDDVVRVMEEIHRVGKAGGKVVILTPHYSCANSFTDPTHKHHLGLFSFDYFTGENEWDFYTTARFRRLSRRIVFYGRYKNLHISWLANRWPRFYEEHLAWIFPAWYMSFELEIVK
jgi:SAM-dependent methyltransferase